MDIYILFGLSLYNTLYTRYIIRYNIIRIYWILYICTYIDSFKQQYTYLIHRYIGTLYIIYYIIMRATAADRFNRIDITLLLYIHASSKAVQ